MTGHVHGKHCKNNPVLTKTIWHVSDMKNKWKQQKNASPYMSWKHSMWYLQPKKTHRSNYENLSGDTWQLSNTAPIATAMCTTKHCFLEICNFLFVAAQQTRGYHAEMPISARKPFISAIIMKTRRNGHLRGTTLHSHNLFSRQFFKPQSVYIRFTHITNMQPKFYLGSAMHHTLERETGPSQTGTPLLAWRAPIPIACQLPHCCRNV